MQPNDPARRLRGRRLCSHTGPALVLALAAACAAPLPSIGGERAAPAAPDVPWTPPPGVLSRDTVARATTTDLPVDLTTHAAQLTLADIVDLALRNNPATRLSWAQARAGAAAYGAAEGRWLPTIDASASLGRTKTPVAPGRLGGERSQYGPSLSLSYLLLDFGGRGGTVSAARQATIALDLQHNSTLQGVVLQVEQAYFGYIAARALLAAAQTTVQEATANLQAAQQRHDVGLATIADVLQARTALSQAQLALETDAGNVQAARGALAVAIGVPANAPYDVEAPSDTIPVSTLAASVDTLIAAAVNQRPDLEAARAQLRQARAQIRVARSEQLPSLALTGSTGRTYSSVPSFEGPSYALTVGIQLPLFDGFARQYDLLAAESEADAAATRADLVRTQVINQVFTSYYALQTATQRVRTSRDLLASAQQSEEVARGRYAAGVGSIIDLLTAQSALADARAQAVQARWGWAISLAQLARDVGVLAPSGRPSLPLTPDTTGIHK